MNNNSKMVLYAEDDENDVFLMERAFEKLEIQNPLRTVGDGKLALAYFEGKAPFADRDENPLPFLFMMDLSMPVVHGLTVLKWIKTQPFLSTMPIVVLTSSNQESDIHNAYELGADGFIVKPGNAHHLLRYVKGIQDYWLSDTRPPGTFIDFGFANGGVIRPPKVALH